MKVFGYIRVSSSGQAKDGYSLDSQRKSIHSFCQSKRLKLLNIYADEGVSGTEAKISERHELLALLADLNQVEAVVVVHTSRLWRDDMTKVLVKREFLNHEVAVVSIDQPQYKINTKDPSEYLVNGMMELLDQFVKMQLVINMERGRQEKLRKGGFPGGGIPLGYTTKDGNLIPVQEEKSVVDLVVALKKKGCAFNKIAKILNEQGVKGKRGGSFYHSTIGKILRNLTYIGELSYGSYKAKGNHQPIMSKVSFARANLNCNFNSG